MDSERDRRKVSDLWKGCFFVEADLCREALSVYRDPHGGEKAREPTRYRPCAAYALQCYKAS